MAELAEFKLVTEEHYNVSLLVQDIFFLFRLRQKVALLHGREF